MDKKIIFAIFVIGLFLLTGCQSKGDTSGSSRTPFIGGTNGILIDFEEGNPPDEVTDDGSFGFKILVKLDNDGEFKVDQDKIKVSLLGIDPSDFSSSLDELTNQEPEDELLAKRKNADGDITEGTTTYVIIPPGEGDELVPRTFTGNTEFTLRADICYLYQTQATGKLCVLSDLINIDENSICDPGASKTVYSSSAPVQVTNLKQSVAGKDKISFSFDIVHSNNGNILKYGDSSSPAADCPKDSSERRSKENRVKVLVDTGLNNLRCSGLDGSDSEGFIALIGGKRTINCIQELPSGRSDYEKDIEITVEYNYEDYKDKKILVKHLSTE